VELTPSKVTNETLEFITPKSPLPGTSTVTISLNGQQFSKLNAVSDLPKELTYDFYEPPYTSFYYPSRGPSNGANVQRHQGFGYMLSRPHLNDQMWARLVNMETNHPMTENIEVQTDNLSIDEWTWNMPEVSGPMEAKI